MRSVPIATLEMDDIAQAVGYYIPRKRDDIMAKAEEMKAENLSFQFIAKRKQTPTFWDYLFGRIDDTAVVVCEVRIG